jgi:hypothetical protein
MTELVTLKSRDGRSTIQCSEKIAATLVATGKYVYAPAESPKPSVPGQPGENA